MGQRRGTGRHQHTLRVWRRPRPVRTVAAGAAQDRRHAWHGRRPRPGGADDVRPRGVPAHPPRPDPDRGGHGEAPQAARTHRVPRSPGRLLPGDRRRHRGPRRGGQLQVPGRGRRPVRTGPPGCPRPAPGPRSSRQRALLAALQGLHPADERAPQQRLLDGVQRSLRTGRPGLAGPVPAGALRGLRRPASLGADRRHGLGGPGRASAGRGGWDCRAGRQSHRDRQPGPAAAGAGAHPGRRPVAPVDGAGGSPHRGGARGPADAPLRLPAHRVEGGRCRHRLPGPGARRPVSGRTIPVLPWGGNTHRRRGRA